MLQPPSLGIPDELLSVNDIFGISSSLEVRRFSQKTALVPPLDPTYVFDQSTTLAILAGFQFNKRVMIQGYHGTGKSTHIEQIAARLNWPCIRINLDSHISRIDLIGRDLIKLKEGKQVTEFQEGLLPFAMQNPIALVFDEYDAGRPDVMFVIQQILEAEGQMVLLEQNRILNPHPFFRIFATTNTLGLGDTTGIYRGTQTLNQAQMDRWNIIAHLNYLEEHQEKAILLSRYPFLDNEEGWHLIHQMIQLAHLTRIGFQDGDLSILMSPRTVMTWIENYHIFKNLKQSFTYSFLNRCDGAESSIIKEYYQRCFGEEI